MKRKNFLKVIVIFMSVIAVLSGCGKKENEYRLEQ